jgi:arylsulfatase A-like enzyme
MTQRQAEAAMPAKMDKPNILVIFGDAIGQANISAYSHGVIGYKTPNIDRIAKQGMLFTDYYAETSGTAGRSSFITGQSPKRTGLSKIGIPGAPLGLQAGDVTIAQALKPLGYATAQFGKNQLGDRNEFLPTVHGFDEFFGNLDDLNAQQGAERPYWTQDGKVYVLANSPRGVLRCRASHQDDPTRHPHWGRVGKQTIEDTGPLNRERMETIDDETTAAAIGYIRARSKAGTPFFVWMNTTRMHRFALRDSMRGQCGMPGNAYADGMIEHDRDVGKLLSALDELGITDETIIIYSTDNGLDQLTWPNAATTPFRIQKDANWEGAFRVPAMIRWPGHVESGEVSNEIVSGLDWFPTLLAAAGNTTIKEDLLRGKELGGIKYKVHLDGHNQLDHLTGKRAKGARTDFAYFNDDGELVAYRYDAWKVVFREQRRPAGFQVWYEPFTDDRIPKVFHLRMDPYERADVFSDQYDKWRLENAYALGWLTIKASAYLQTFEEHPPSRSRASFTIKCVATEEQRKIEEAEKNR